ncbi:protein of integral membrane protein, Mpv17/PMP22 family [Pseudohyphozyma bogoriensis]|nr:protein of integral membrane protein, Mpv17/PMP22 family [Pseudohyphozyma bogoriensis]
MAFIFRGYIRLLQKYTLPTQMATGGCTSALGDIIYQQGVEKKGWENHEWTPTMRLAFYGGCCFAPFNNRCHWIMNRIKLPSKVKTLASRVSLDALVFAPMSTCLFYTCQGAMEQRPFMANVGDVQCVKERLSERIWPTLWKQWMVFLPAQMINLTLIPIYARPPFMNCFAIAWNVFLASAQAKGQMPITQGDKAEDRGRDSATIAVEIMQ